MIGFIHLTDYKYLSRYDRNIRIYFSEFLALARHRNTYSCHSCSVWEYSNSVTYKRIITYDEDMKITFHGHRWVTHDGNYSYHFVEQHPYRKLFLEEQLQVARFGAMRAIKLKEKLINSHLV